jgi:serine/threonine-protein kinase
MAISLKFPAIMLGLVSLPAMAAPPPRFPSAAVWHQDISTAPLHANSTSMLNTLNGLGGWGNGRFQIDFSIHVYHDAPADAPRRTVIPHRSSGEYWTPDCEALPTTMPVPTDAAFEDSDGLTCDNNGSDCHLLVQQGSTLYELYSGNLSGGVLDARCLAVWNLSAVYPPEGRGEHCTSGDAAGFPIAPLLVNADEVAAKAGVANSDLGHAIRFVLPNVRMASDNSLGGVGGRLYVRPASHAGGPNGPTGSVPYGVRMRLKSNFDMNGYNAAAQVILRTMQRYGIVLADGGDIALTFESDRYTTAKWSNLGIGPHIFWNGGNGSTPVKVTHFDIIDTGPRIGETWNCVRSSVATFDPLFENGFDPPV